MPSPQSGLHDPPWHVVPDMQTPQEPPQLSGPQLTFVQAGVQQVAPTPPLPDLQTCPGPQGQSCWHDWQSSLAVGWQVPSPQLAWFTQVPFWQTWLEPQIPQTPPHASLPHCFPAHCLAQHALLKQTSPVPQRQSPEQLPQFSPLWQTPLPHTSARAHFAFVPHT
jgi:hypothetical protein